MENILTATFKLLNSSLRFRNYLLHTTFDVFSLKIIKIYEVYFANHDSPITVRDIMGFESRISAFHNIIGD